MKDYKQILQFLVARLGGRYKHTTLCMDGETTERFSICPPDSNDWVTFDSADSALDALVDAIAPDLVDNPFLLMNIFLCDEFGDSPNDGGDE